jgi:ABC-type transport system involved in cytochrome c biogenesis permease component
MRWLLLKDLQILRRSPLVSALLVLYPIAIAVLIGFALSRGPEKPRVAFYNEIPAQQQFSLGGRSGEFSKSQAKAELCSRVECIDVSSRDEAKQKVEDGDVLGALILPADLIDKLDSLTSLSPEQPKVDVLVNEEDPIKAQLVDDRIESLVTEANLLVSQRVSQTAGRYLDLLVKGGHFDFPLLGQSLDILGLDRAGQILDSVRRDLPPGSAQQKALDQVIHFGRLASQNLDFALPLLGAVAQPIAVNKEVVSGSTPPLDVFAIAVAAAITLMFVTVLLVAGSLALEREENAYPRLTRGLLAPGWLLAEKVLLGMVLSLLVTLLMLLGLDLFVNIDWGRLPLILAAIIAGGAGFAAFGAAIGGLAREVRASSLLAFMISLPIAFLSLVPSGTVSPGLFDVIQVVRVLFPFHAALDAITRGLDAAGPALGPALLNLALIVLAYGALARLSLRRFA